MSRKKVLLVLIGLLVAGLVTAQEIPPIYLNFWDFQQTYLDLYPEADYNRNPATLLQLHRPVFLNYLNLNGSSGKTLNTHDPDDTPANGTQNTEAYSSTDLLMIDGFFPLSDRMVAGISGMARLNFFNWSRTRMDWTVANEDELVEYSDNDQSYEGNGFLAFGLNGLSLGAKAGASGQSDPYSFRWTTDPAVQSAPYESGLAPQDYTLCRIAPAFTLGGLYATGPYTFGLSAAGRYTRTNRTYFTGFDSNTSSYIEEEEIIPRIDDERTNQGNPDYDEQELYTRMMIYLYPSLIWNMSDYFSLIVTGHVNPWDSATYLKYQRYLASELNEVRIDNRFLDFGAIITAAFRPTPELEIRAGLGYTGTRTRQTNNELDAAGVSVFLPANTEHYPEVTFTGEPDNYDVQGALTPIGNKTYQEYTHLIRSIIAFQYIVAQRVLLFGGATLNFRNEIFTYRVFDDATDKVWEEKSISNNFALAYNTVVGVGVFLTNAIFVGLQGDTGSLSLSSSRDSLPTLGGTASQLTEPGSFDLTDENSSDFNISLFCIIGL